VASTTSLNERIRCYDFIVLSVIMGSVIMFLAVSQSRYGDYLAKGCKGGRLRRHALTGVPTCGYHSNSSNQQNQESYWGALQHTGSPSIHSMVRESML
jgi:hypothetical protein